MVSKEMMCIGSTFSQKMTHISLPHNPRPEKNNAGGWYYTLSEMLSGRHVVYTDSK